MYTIIDLRDTNNTSESGGHLSFSLDSIKWHDGCGPGIGLQQRRCITTASQMGGPPLLEKSVWF